MELKEFIQQTITQIIDGVLLAQTSLKDKGAIVIPANLQGVNTNGAHLSEDGITYFVDVVMFEANLAEDITKENKRSIWVNLKIIGADGSNNGEQTKGQSTSVKFSIPLLYPCSPLRPRYDKASGKYSIY